MDSPVAPPRTSVPTNHPGLTGDAIPALIFPVKEGDDLKKEAASEEDKTARTVAAVENLIATELFKLKVVELLYGRCTLLVRVFFRLLAVCLLHRETIELVNFNRSVENHNHIETPSTRRRWLVKEKPLNLHGFLLVLPRGTRGNRRSIVRNLCSQGPGRKTSLP